MKTIKENKLLTFQKSFSPERQSVNRKEVTEQQHRIQIETSKATIITQKADGFFDERGSKTELQKKHTLKTRTRKNATAPENPI